jgi:DNA polymerase-3 subunit epsilon
MHHALDDVILRHDIQCQNRHRALDDAKVLWEFLQIVDKTVEPSALEEAISKAMGIATLPSGASRDLVNHLPHAPGVYLFYGADKELLYVGKSIDIKARVMSHFSGDHLSAKELRMMSEVVDIEYRETTGELSALFLESKLIKELSPVYNRALRKVRQLALMLERVNDDGYKTVEVEYRGRIDVEDLPNLLGVFRTVRQAKEFLQECVREGALCGKLLGLEKGKGACFQYQLERCKGACAEIEQPLKYNARFVTLFQKRRIKTWPYSGPVVIKDEVDEYDGTAYVIDNWCLVKTFAYSGTESSEALSTAVEFDYDAYKILARYLVQNEGRRTISPYDPRGAKSFEERTIG